MHSVLLGIVKKLLEAWFSSKCKLKSWYTGHSVNILDKKLRNIKTPNVIDRIPGSFNDLKHWKASEYRNFPLFIQYQFCGKHYQIFTISIFHA